MARTIRPALRRPRKPAAAPQRTIAPGAPPFDAEAHFADYDHEAVMAFSKKVLICPATFDRKGTVRYCLGATNKHKLGAKMYIHDDGSGEYDAEWLSQFCDRVYRHKKGKGGRHGVKELRTNIVKSIMGDFEPQTFQPWLKEDFGSEGPEYLYMVDSDGYHDPHFLYRIHEIMEKYDGWGTITLYNAKFHAPKRGRAENNPIDEYTVLRGVSGGISMFFRMKSFYDRPKMVQVPDRRGWDGFYSREIAMRRVVTSLVSYVEHFGKWGFHNKGNFDRCRAITPTKYLTDSRDETIAAIEKEFTTTARRRKHAD